MADIFVKVVPDANGVNCLRLIDLDREDNSNLRESGVACRKMLHQRNGDTINWWALAGDGALSITFSGVGAPTPFVNGLNQVATVTINGRNYSKIASSALKPQASLLTGRYKYTISLGTGAAAVVEDPQIFIDTDAIGVLVDDFRGTKKATKKKAAKKKAATVKR